MGNTAKYIIVDGIAIVFCDALGHNDVARAFNNKNVESAGFVRFAIRKDEYDNDEVFVKAYGESVSLRIKSREEDSDLITRQICQ